MGHDPKDNPFNPPYSLAQNPAPVREVGQDYQRKKQALVNDIMRTFLGLLPSNYVAVTNGPWYTLQFQAIAEQLAAIQILAGEVGKDSDFDLTRTEFLWEVLGTLVFPGADERNGAPLIDGDTTYRAFLHKMVLFLLRGSTAAVVEEGTETVTGVNVELIEKFLHSVQRDPNGAWTIDNQFEMELNIEGFPPGNPFIIQGNVEIVLEALKPAHTLFEYRHLFRDTFGDAFEGHPADDTNGMSWELNTYYYDDLRKNCYGVKEILGTGDTLADRTLFTDPTLSFATVQVGAVLHITAGVNAGRYRVIDVRAFPIGVDTTPRAYTTSPSGLAGTATVAGDVITAASQNWALAEEGEILTFLAGPNAGSYRLDILLGPNGGLLGADDVTGPATQVRVSPSLLRVERRMPVASVVGQSYKVTVDRLGVRFPRTKTGEDVSEQFFL
jgi:hypothetical protein